MKRTLLLSVLIISCTISMLSQDKASDLKKLLEIMQVEKTIEGYVNSLTPMLKQQVGTQFKNENDKEKFDTYIEFLMQETKALAQKLANEEMIDIYSKHFTHGEIKDLIKFYESPTGKKILEKTPVISSDMMNAMSSKYFPEFQERLKNKIEELKGQ